jgi:hypothetical protein
MYYAPATQWITDFQNTDYADEIQLLYNTMDVFHVDGREPGTAGQTYTLLYWPMQIETLMSTDAIIYLGFDLIDDDTSLPASNDNGTLSCSQVDVDMIHRPAEGSGRAEAELTHNTFPQGTSAGQWNPGIQLLNPAGNIAGVTASAGTQLTISMTSADELFEASVVGPMPTGVPLEPGRYYRVVFMVTSSQQAGGDMGPLNRCGLVSSRFVYAADKTMKGGGTWSAIGSTPEPYEIWVAAPSGLTTTQTEGMQLRFASWTTFNFDVLLGRNQSGTVTCTEIRTESFAPWP